LQCKERNRGFGNPERSGLGTEGAEIEKGGTTDAKTDRADESYNVVRKYAALAWELRLRKRRPPGGESIEE